MAAAMVDMWEAEAALAGECNDDEWQRSCKEIKQRGAHLLNSAAWTDCSFLVGAARVEIKAHKLILSMASPVFADMFFEDPPQDAQDGATSASIEISDVQPDAFQLMLNYIYTENIDMSSYITTVYEVYTAAHKFVIPQLTRVCAMYISCNLQEQDALHALQLGMQYDEQMIVQESLMLIRRNTRELLLRPEFTELSLPALTAILEQGLLEISNELQLWQAVERWVDARNDDVPMQRLGDIVSILPHMRFLTLTPEQFASGPARSALLTQQQSLAVLMNLTGVSVPMPEGFSDNKQPRGGQPAPPPRLPPVKRSPSLPPSFLSFRLAVRLDPLNQRKAPNSIMTLPMTLLHVNWAAKMVPRVCVTSRPRTEAIVQLGFYVRCENPPHHTFSQASAFTFTSAEPEHGFPNFLEQSRALASYARENVLEVNVIVRTDNETPTTTRQ